jgi:hypothetical protein
MLNFFIKSCQNINIYILKYSAISSFAYFVKYKFIFYFYKKKKKNPSISFQPKFLMESRN